MYIKVILLAAFLLVNNTTTAFADYITDMLQAADSAFSDGDYSRAIDYYGRATRRTSNIGYKTRAMRGHIEALLAIGADRKAFEITEQLLRVDPADLWAKDQFAVLSERLITTLPTNRQSVRPAPIAPPMAEFQLLEEAQLISDNWRSITEDFTITHPQVGLLGVCSGGGFLVVRLYNENGNRFFLGNYYGNYGKIAVNIPEVKEHLWSVEAGGSVWDISNLPAECSITPETSSSSQLSNVAYMGEFVELQLNENNTISERQYGVFTSIHYDRLRYQTQGSSSFRDNKIEFSALVQGDRALGNLRANLFAHTNGAFYLNSQNILTLNPTRLINLCFSEYVIGLIEIFPDTIPMMQKLLLESYGNSAQLQWEYSRNCSNDADVIVTWAGDTELSDYTQNLDFRRYTQTHSNLIDRLVDQGGKSKSAELQARGSDEGVVVIMAVGREQLRNVCFGGSNAAGMEKSTAELLFSQTAIGSFENASADILERRIIDGTCGVAIVNPRVATRILRAMRLNGIDPYVQFSSPDDQATENIDNEITWADIEKHFEAEQIRNQELEQRQLAIRAENIACQENRECRCNRARSNAEDEYRFAIDYLARVKMSTGENPHPLLVRSMMEPFEYANRIAQSTCGQ